jgi:hypothetical protein
LNPQAFASFSMMLQSLESRIPNGSHDTLPNTAFLEEESSELLKFTCSSGFSTSNITPSDDSTVVSAVNNSVELTAVGEELFEDNTPLHPVERKQSVETNKIFTVIFFISRPHLENIFRILSFDSII